MRLLVVDDSQLNRKLLRDSLVAERHEVAEAANGLEAMDALQRGTFDAVITDVLMPRMDGFRLCIEIRKGEAGIADIPVVLYTATYDSAADRLLAESVGADSYLMRPAPLPVILAAIEEARRKASARPRSGVATVADPYILERYSSALVDKLESRNAELQEAVAALRASHDQIRVLNASLEDRVAERTATLSEANEQLDAFTHSVSHDLRTPLRAIGGYVHLIEMDKENRLSPASTAMLQNVEHAVQRMNALIDGLLAFAHASHKELQLAEVDLDGLVDMALETLQFDFAGRNVEWHRSRLPRVRGDATLLLQVFVNLISNALKYSRSRDPARIEIDVRADCEDPQEIYVRDNGVGFDMRHAHNLFGVFRRLHGESEFEGCGIGLANAQRIVKRHGGRIRGVSEVGKGATFTISLPCNRP